MGKSVVLIEPTRRLGGLTSGGLGQTDIGNKAAIGGIAREFYRAVRRYYDDPAAWKWQTRAQYADSGQTRTASARRAGAASGLRQASRTATGGQAGARLDRARQEAGPQETSDQEGPVT